MLRKYHTIKINLPGGIVSAGDLYRIVNIAGKADVNSMQFGSRQQLYFEIKDEKLAGFQKDMEQLRIFYETGADEHPNIVSSYVSDDVFPTANWLREGVYKDILDQFYYSPKLKINIVDNTQSFVPFFTGHLNFVASPVSNYWYLIVRFPKSNKCHDWKVLVYSDNIARVCKRIEEIIFNNKELFYGKEAIDIGLLYAMVQDTEKFIEYPVSELLKIPEFALPYYEGFNRYGDKMWLGIYRRNEEFRADFLKDLCTICLQTKIAQLYTTPWKSIIIKGINQGDRKLWDYVLGKYRINVRHALNELNWQVEDLCIEGLTLKNFLVRQFDKDDVRTFGLCFAVKTRRKSSVFGSVIIRKQPTDNSRERRSFDRFDILYTKDFNPNSKEYILFRRDLEKEHLYPYLASLCKYFYELQSEDELVAHDTYRDAQQPEEIRLPEQFVYQCADCFTIYDEAYGDITNDIAPGIPFQNLPENYNCPTCAATTTAFKLVAKPGVTSH